MADQIEQQAVQQQEAEQANAVVEALEAGEEATETVVIETDVPDVPALEPVQEPSPEKSDLPE